MPCSGRAPPRGGRIWARGVWRRLCRAVFSRPAAADTLNGAAGLHAQTKDGCHAPGLHARCSHGGPPPPSLLLTSPSPPMSLSNVPPTPTCSQPKASAPALCLQPSAAPSPPDRPGVQPRAPAWGRGDAASHAGTQGPQPAAARVQLGPEQRWLAGHGQSDTRPCRPDPSLGRRPSSAGTLGATGWGAALGDPTTGSLGTASGTGPMKHAGC